MAGHDNTLLRELARAREERGSGKERLVEANFKCETDTMTTNAAVAAREVIDLTSDGGMDGGEGEEEEEVVHLRSLSWGQAAPTRRRGEQPDRTGLDDDTLLKRRRNAVAAGPRPQGFHTFKIINDSSGGAAVREDEVTLRDLMVVDGVIWDEVVLENFMIDPWWLVSTSLGPDSARFYKESVRKLLLIADKSNKGPVDLCGPFRSIGMKRVDAMYPPLPLSYGVHHTKLMLLASFEHGLRVVITTANFIRGDVEGLLQVRGC